MTPFPQAESVWQDGELAKRWDKLLAYRSQVQGVLEASRRDKVIGSSLEAHVQLQADADTYRFLHQYEKDLSTIFIVSKVTLTTGSGGEGPLHVTVEKSTAGKCERCWNYREAVGANAAHPTLCDRCVEAIR
jgi:isoleucyl-tRNA synthetase